MAMKEVPMDEVPLEDEEVKFVKRDDGVRTIYKGLEYLPCNGGYMLCTPEIHDGVGIIPPECYDIPREVDGKPVVKIHCVAFSYLTTKALKRVIIPDSVVEIDESAFASISGLKNVAFIIDPNNPKYKVIDGNLYSKDGKTLLAGIGKGDDNEIFVVPDGISELGAYALRSYKCTGIIIPSSVKRIGKEAFPLGYNEYFSNTNIYFKGTKNQMRIPGLGYARNVYVYKEGKPSLFNKHTWHFAADGVTPEITKK